MGSPVSDICAAIRRGLLELSTQLSERTLRFKEGRAARAYMKEQPENDGKQNKFNSQTPECSSILQCIC